MDLPIQDKLEVLCTYQEECAQSAALQSVATYLWKMEVLCTWQEEHA
jgi:hypothetical protein